MCRPGPYWQHLTKNFTTDTYYVVSTVGSSHCISTGLCTIYLINYFPLPIKYFHDYTSRLYNVCNLPYTLAAASNMSLAQNAKSVLLPGNNKWPLHLLPKFLHKTYFPPANTTCEHKNQNMTTYKYNFAKHNQPAHKSTHARTGGWVTYNITRTYRPLPQPTRVNSAIKDTTNLTLAPFPLSNSERES